MKFYQVNEVGPRTRNLCEQMIIADAKISIRRAMGVDKSSWRSQNAHRGDGPRTRILCEQMIIADATASGVRRALTKAQGGARMLIAETKADHITKNIYRGHKQRITNGNPLKINGNQRISMDIH